MNSKHLHILHHPIIEHELCALREKTTPHARFREAMHRVGLFLASEAFRQLRLNTTRLHTPMQETSGRMISDDVVIIPILRAGLGLLEPFLTLYPAARVGHLGMYRDENTFQPVDYYAKLPPESSNSAAFIIDPMLATGGSACDAIVSLQKKQVSNITFVCLIAAPEGLKRLNETFPDVPIITACVDDGLNENAFILPGLGDAGDRYFGTV